MAGSRKLERLVSALGYKSGGHLEEQEELNRAAAAAAVSLVQQGLQWRARAA